MAAAAVVVAILKMISSLIAQYQGRHVGCGD